MSRITVIGLGKLGLCNALIFEKGGYSVFGVELSQAYCDQLNSKSFRSEEPGVNEYLKDSVDFTASTSLSDGLSFSDMIYLIVDTPLGQGNEFYDHSRVTKLLREINNQKVKNKHIILACTVMPGYINKVGLDLISDCENTTLNYNPEFIVQGDIISSYINPDMILIGAQSREAAEKIENLHLSFCRNEPQICNMSPSEAEVVKLSVNGFVTTKLSYANMIGEYCHRAGIDSDIVLSAVGQDTRVGNKYFKSGLSFGGPCFPRDTKALSVALSEMGVEPLITEATHDYNELHVGYVTNRLLRTNKDVYIFDNVSFKDNCVVPIIEESAKLKIARKLVMDFNKKVIIRDRQVVLDKVKSEFGEMFEYIVKLNG